MKEKIKRIGLIVFYILVWLIFVFSFLFVLVGLSQLDEIKNGWKVLAVVTLSFFSAYLLRQQIKYLVQLTWKQKLILSIIFIVFGLFYWLQIRPSHITSKCNREAIEAVTQTKKLSMYDFSYKLCLRREGINK